MNERREYAVVTEWNVARIEAAFYEVDSRGLHFYDSGTLIASFAPGQWRHVNLVKPVCTCK